MTKKSAFDAASLDTTAACNKAAEIEIKHPITGASTGIFISVLGADSDVYRNIIRAMANESLRKQAQGKAPAAESFEKLEEKNTEALVAVTVSWRTNDDSHIVLHGEPLDCTPENARKLYSAIAPIRDQVQAGVQNLENFMAAS